MPWGVVAGAAVSAIGGAIQSGNAKDAANANSAAASAAGQQQLAATAPYNLQTPFGNVGYMTGTGGPNQASASLSPQYQAIQQGLYGNSATFMQQLQGLQANGGVSPSMQNAYNSYQSAMPSSSSLGVNPSTSGINPSLSGVQGYANALNSQQLPQQYMQNMQGASQGASALMGQYQQQAQNPNQVSDNGLGNSFNAASGGMLGALGSYDPNQAAQSYTNNLRAQALPQNQIAANGLAQNLFNTGRLGSTGGATLEGQLSLAQQQADTGMQVAGQQYAQQQQQGLSSMAQSLGQTGTGINNSTASLNSQLGSQALSNYGNASNLGMSADQSMYGQSANQYGLQNSQLQNAFNNSMGMNQTAYQRSTDLNNTDYSRGMTQSDDLYSRQAQSAQQGYSNQMSNLAAGQTNLQNTYNMGTGLLNQGIGIDQNLQQQMALGGQLGAMRNTGGINTALQGQIGANNAGAAANNQMIGSIANGASNVIGGYNWGGIQNYGSGAASNGAVNQQLGNYQWDTQPIYTMNGS